MMKNNLPKYWIVRHDGSELFKTVIEYLNKTYNRVWSGNAIGKYYGVDGNDYHRGTNAEYNILEFKNNPTILTLEEFIKLLEPVDIEKKILGYRLKDNCKQYENAARKIVASESREVYVDGIYEVSGTASVELNDAGVLDLWFEPVYESTEKTISVGGKFDVVLKNGKIFHKADDITDFVLELLEYFKVVNTFDDYPVLIKEVTFSHTGCQEKITTLTDWQEVCTEWKKFNT